MRTGTVVTDQPLKRMQQVFIVPLTVFIVPLTVHEDLYVICCKCRLKKSNVMQQYADNYLLLNYSTCTCFGGPSHPSSGVDKTVVAASGTDRTIWGASFLKRDQIRTQSLFGHV